MSQHSSGGNNRKRLHGNRIVTVKPFLYVQIQRRIFVRFMLRINLLSCRRRVINTVPQAGNTHFSEVQTMKTKMNLNGTTRKALVAAIAEITGEKAI